MVIPLERWNVVAREALRLAWSLSPDIHILHVECGEDTEILRQRYADVVEVPARAAGLPVPELAVLESPYRFIVRPIVDYSLHLEKTNPDTSQS